MIILLACQVRELAPQLLLAQQTFEHLLAKISTAGMSASSQSLSRRWKEGEKYISVVSNFIHFFNE